MGTTPLHLIYQHKYHSDFQSTIYYASALQCYISDMMPVVLAQYYGPPVSLSSKTNA